MGNGSAASWITNAVALGVLVAWLTAMGIGAIEHDWTALTVTTPVMMVLAGYAFGVKIIQRQKTPKSEDERWTHLP